MHTGFAILTAPVNGVQTKGKTERFSRKVEQADLAKTVEFVK